MELREDPRPSGKPPVGTLPETKQRCTSKGIGRQGVVLKRRKFLTKGAYALSSYALTDVALKEDPDI